MEAEVKLECREAATLHRVLWSLFAMVWNRSMPYQSIDKASSHGCNWCPDSSPCVCDRSVFCTVLYCTVRKLVQYCRISESTYSMYDSNWAVQYLKYCMMRSILFQPDQRYHTVWYQKLLFKDRSGTGYSTVLYTVSYKIWNLSNFQKGDFVHCWWPETGISWKEHHDAIMKITRINPCRKTFIDIIINYVFHVVIIVYRFQPLLPRHHRGQHNQNLKSHSCDFGGTNCANSFTSPLRYCSSRYLKPAQSINNAKVFARKGDGKRPPDICNLRVLQAWIRRTLNNLRVATVVDCLFRRYKCMRHHENENHFPSHLPIREAPRWLMFNLRVRIRKAICDSWARTRCENLFHFLP